MLLPRFVLAGLALAGLELLLVIVSGRELFLSVFEIGRYALLAFTLLPVFCAAIGTLVHGALALVTSWAPRGSQDRVLGVATLVVSTPLLSWALWSLTSGRRVRALPGRLLVVCLLALALACVLAWIVQMIARARAGGQGSRLFVAALLLALFALALDMHGLRRLYPAFHWSLSTVAVGSALVAMLLASEPTALRDRPAWQWMSFSLFLCAGAALNIWGLSLAPNARFAIVETTPLSGKLLRLARARTRLVSEAKRQSSQSLAPSHRPGIDLRGGDVLLITIDALRADRLQAYGGHGLTPALDALAAESVVFLRAYTPTPHTSYALSSLMTGKFMQPLLSLADAGSDHPTLAGLVRRHGYRTAAFYPPAIFFVDGERFEWMRRGQLGFEYVKAMFASAEDRVPQLEQYLREVEPGHPLLVWVHLFEPHEPYEPPPQFARGDTPVARYDGEVAAADAAVAKLVAAFRAVRPLATVIVSADHGEEFGDHGGHHHGTTLFDEQVRVPLLWSSPGKTQARLVSAPVGLVDLAPTLLTAFGIPSDVRMRGADLGPLLLGSEPLSSARAYALIDGARMVTDGRQKLICGEDDCRLFDLVRDPSERRDLVLEQSSDATRLRAELSDFMASLPRVEALAMRRGGAWPDALTRARLGDASAKAELVPLLAAERADVRAAAARAAGELLVEQADKALSRMRKSDADSEARAEAAIAALRLGEVAARDQVAALLGDASAKAADLARQAALALAGRGDAIGETVLIAAANDAALEETQRLLAIRALSGVGRSRACQGLIPLLAEVRLRSEVADALGRIGDAAAVPVLLERLAKERYPISRRAEARALLALGARRQAVDLIRRFLGTDSSLPDGVAMLLDARALVPDSGQGADLARATAVRRGSWECQAPGCRPLARASIALPSRGAPAGAVRVVLRAMSDGPRKLLRVSGVAHELSPGPSELAIAFERGRRINFDLDADPGVWLQGIAVVAVRDDIPPPPPEPW